MPDLIRSHDILRMAQALDRAPIDREATLPWLHGLSLETGWYNDPLIDFDPLIESHRVVRMLSMLDDSPKRADLLFGAISTLLLEDGTFRGSVDALPNYDWAATFRVIQILNEIDMVEAKEMRDQAVLAIRDRVIIMITDEQHNGTSELPSFALIGSCASLAQNNAALIPNEVWPVLDRARPQILSSHDNANDWELLNFMIEIYEHRPGSEGSQVDPALVRYVEEVVVDEWQRWEMAGYQVGQWDLPTTMEAALLVDRAGVSFRPSEIWRRLDVYWHGGGWLSEVESPVTAKDTALALLLATEVGFHDMNVEAITAELESLGERSDSGPGVLLSLYFAAMALEELNVQPREVWIDRIQGVAEKESRRFLGDTAYRSYVLRWYSRIVRDFDIPIADDLQVLIREEVKSWEYGLTSHENINAVIALQEVSGEQRWSREELLAALMAFWNPGGGFSVSKAGGVAYIASTAKGLWSLRSLVDTLDGDTCQLTREFIVSTRGEWGFSPKAPWRADGSSTVKREYPTVESNGEAIRALRLLDELGCPSSFATRQERLIVPNASAGCLDCSLSVRIQGV